MMLASRTDEVKFNLWQSYGGFETLASYQADDIFGRWETAVPAEHWRFLESTLPYFETATHLFVHASAEPELAMHDQPEKTLYWASHNDTQPHHSGKTIICGHTSQKNGTINNRDHAVCIDTWPIGAWLTCVELNESTVWQTNEQGEKKGPFDL